MSMLAFVTDQMRTRDMPYWKVWFRDVTKSSKGYNADVTQNYEDNIDESVATLEHLLASTDVKVFTVQISDSPNVRFSAESGNRFPVKKDPASAHRLSGHGSSTHAIAGQNVDSYIAGQIDQRMQIYDLKQQVANLESAGQAEMSNWEKVIDAISGIPADSVVGQMIATFGPMMASKFMGTNPQVAMHGFPPGKESAVEVEANSQPMTTPQDEAAQLTQALERLAVHFENLPEMLTKLADAVDEKPTMIKMMINNYLN